MAVHPIEGVVIDTTNVVKDPFREEIKQLPREFATAANFRNHDLPNTPNMLIGGKLFSYDAADITTADDGVTCIHDAGARRFKIVPVVVAGFTVFEATVVAGSADAIELTVPGMATLSATPQFVWFTPVANNTTTVTIKFNGGAFVALKSPRAAALAADDIQDDVPYLIRATSTDAQIRSSGATY